jgi:hypothetical protein
MSANHTNFETAVVAAGVTALAAKATAETARHGIIAASGSSVGYRPGWPTGFAAYAAAVAAAATQKVVDDTTIEQTKQSAITSAKELLRSQGELP